MTAYILLRQVRVLVSDFWINSDFVIIFDM